MKIVKWRFGTLLVVGILGIFGYHFWKTITHGYIYFNLKTKTQAVVNAQIQILDGDQQIIAEGHTDPADGLVYFKHPEIGFCDEIEKKASFSSEARDAWKSCASAQAKWVIHWADKVKFVKVLAPGCQTQILPIQVRKYRSDWWLWWVPHPHIGDSGYTTFHFDLLSEPVDCP